MGLILTSFLPLYAPSLFIKSVRTMLAAIFTAIAPFQQVLFTKDDVAFRTFVKVIGLKIWLAEKVIHGVAKEQY